MKLNAMIILIVGFTALGFAIDYPDGRKLSGGPKVPDWELGVSRALDAASSECWTNNVGISATPLAKEAAGSTPASRQPSIIQYEDETDAGETSVVHTNLMFHGTWTSNTFSPSAIVQTLPEPTFYRNQKLEDQFASKSFVRNCTFAEMGLILLLFVYLWRRI